MAVAPTSLVAVPVAGTEGEWRLRFAPEDGWISPGIGAFAREADTSRGSKMPGCEVWYASQRMLSVLKLCFFDSRDALPLEGASRPPR